MGEMIKILIALFLISMVGSVVFYMFQVNPLFGLVALVILSLILIALFDPATAKTTSHLVLPLVILMFVYYIIVYPVSLGLVDIILIGVILYFMFMLFAGTEGLAKTAILKSKIAAKIMPAYLILMVVALVADTTGKLAAITLSGSVLALMILYLVLLKDYDSWPTYHWLIGKEAVVVDELTPKGRIRIGNELWWAVSADNSYIPKDESVVVIGTKGLTLIVKQKPSKI